MPQLPRAASNPRPPRPPPPPEADWQVPTGVAIGIAAVGCIALGAMVAPRSLEGAQLAGWAAAGGANAGAVPVAGNRVIPGTGASPFAWKLDALLPVE